MSALTLTLLRFGFLLLLWVFVLLVLSVLRRDVYGGTTVTTRRRRPATAAPPSGYPGPVGTPPEPGPNTLAPAMPPSAAAQPHGASVQRASELRQDHLVVTAGSLAGTTLPLGSGPVHIGRAPANTLVLDDDYCSARHARVYQEGDQRFLEDLGSTNGTFLGNQRVHGAVPLPYGMPIRIGQSTIELAR